MNKTMTNKYNSFYKVYRIRWYNFADQEVYTRLFAGKLAIYEMLHSGILPFERWTDKMQFTYYRISIYTLHNTNF